MKALIVAGSPRRHGRGRDGSVHGGWGLEGHAKSHKLCWRSGIELFIFVAAGVFCCREAAEGFHQFISYVHTEYQTLCDLGSSC